jgi:hypothetical protein
MWSVNHSLVPCVENSTAGGRGLQLAPCHTTRSRFFHPGLRRVTMPMGKLVFQVTGAFAASSARWLGNGSRLESSDAARSKALLTIAAAYRGHDGITDAVRAPLCGAATLFRDREREVTAQLVVSDSKNTITLPRSSADVSPPYGFMLWPGTTSSGFAMKRSSFSLSHTKSAPFMALE